MSNRKTTKRALMTSVLAMFMCLTMLVGTTFAWFTDTASTGVNQIVSGTLDVALEMWDGTEWVSAEGKTLDFVKAAGAAENEAILWEPGCTYSLPKLRIVNKGNLALKYKVVITGILGDAKLNEVIDWKIGDAAQGTDKKLAAGAAAEFTISGTMKTTADNAYQGLTIKGISITVCATQDTVESDSNGNTYDSTAAYPYPAYSVSQAKPESGSVTLATNGVYPVQVTIDAAVLPASVTSFFLKHEGIAVDSATNAVKFSALELLDQNGDKIDLSNNTANPITVVLNASGIDDGTVVYIYHDGELVAAATVTDGKITYQAYHFCDVVVVPDSNKIIVSSNQEFLAALGSADKNEIVLAADICYDWGTNSYENANNLALQNKVISGITGKETLTFKGYGSANNVKNVTLKNLNIADQTTGDNEGSWEHGYLEFENLTADNVNFVDQIQLNGTCVLNNCTLNGTKDQYAAWVNSGNATFNNCSVQGQRSIKVHEAYGSDVTSVVVDGCTFTTSAKPGVVIGTVDSTTSITIKNSTFIGVPAGDQGKYIYETDTDVETFNFSESDNNVIKAYYVSDMETLKKAVTDEECSLIILSADIVNETVPHTGGTSAYDPYGVADTFTLKAGRELTIDFNGYILTTPVRLFNIKGGATLTLTNSDNSGKQSGIYFNKVDSDPNYGKNAYGIYVTHNGGKNGAYGILNIEKNVTLGIGIENAAAQPQGMIWNCGKVTLDGGELIAYGTAAVYIFSSPEGDFIMNDGKITLGDSNAIGIFCSLNGNADLQLVKGSIEGEGTSYEIVSFPQYNLGVNEVHVGNGFTINTKKGPQE